MKQRMKALLKYTGVFAVTLLVLWSALVLSALIPNKALQENMVRSSLFFLHQDAFEYTQQAQINSVADHYADSIWLNVAWNVGIGDPLTASIRTNYYDGGEQGENAGLYYTVTEGADPNNDYTRYWHGTVIFIRLLSLFTDAEGIKMIGFIVLLLLMALSAAMLIKMRHWDLAVLLALSLAAVRIWNIRLSMEYQPAFLVAFAILPLWLLLERRDDKYLILLSVISGTVVAFFDFLTTETVTVLLPLVLIIAVRAKENRLGSFRRDLSVLVKCGVAWGGAYMGAFVVKWILASLVTGTNSFAVALTSVNERIGGTVQGFAEQPDSFLSAPLANLTMLFGGQERVVYGRVFLGVGIFLLVLLTVWYLLRKKQNQSAAAALMLGLGAVVLVRYLLLNNHSYLHCYFTYRALVTLIFALLASVWLNIELPQRKKRGQR